MAVHKKKVCFLSSGWLKLKRRAVAIFFSQFFFFFGGGGGGGGGILSIFGGKKMFARMGKKSLQSHLFLATRPLYRKHNYLYGQPIQLVNGKNSKV